ncbi:MAG: hypothetical protein GX173_02260 [Ruminococcaceae bacterium]|nr:hypothetical protein [Oscillospiraceae bacterium]
MKQRNWHDRVFFGLHFDLHANEKDTELGRALTVEHLITQLSKIKPDFVQCDCKGHPGYTSYPTKIGVPSPGIIQDAVRIWRDATRQLDIPLGMHYSGVWDTAALLRHPEWGRINNPAGEQAKGEKAGGHDPNMTCPSSDYTDAYMIPQMLEIIEEYDVDGFWVDGENWASAPCYCHTCQAGFRALYGDVPAPETPEQPLWQAWLAYSRDRFVDHVRRYADAVHQKKPDCTICSNWMYTVRQPEPIAAPVDYISGDFSHIWSAEKATVEARFMDSRPLSWDLMAWSFSSHGAMRDWVFKSAGALCQEAAVVMSCGGAFMIYDTPNRDGTLVAWHMDELAKVAQFCRARQAFCQDTKTVPQIVLLHAREHYYSNNEPLYQLGTATDPLEGALHVLLENNLHVDIRNTEDLIQSIGRFPLCVVAEQDQLSDDTVAVLEQYVRDGGYLLISGAEQTKRFDALLGVRDARPDSLDQALFLPVDNGAVCAIGHWRQVEITENETKEVSPLLLSRDRGESERLSGGSAATIRPLGKGKIAGIYGPLFASYTKGHYPAVRSYISRLMALLNHPDLLKASAPAHIQITLRKKEDQLMVHLVNMGVDHPLSPKSPFVEQVPTAGPVALRLPLDNRPYQVCLMPAATPVCWSYADGQLSVSISQVGIHDILVIKLSPDVP